MKILTYIIGIILLLSLVAASSPPSPMPLVLVFYYEGVPVDGLTVSITVEGNTVLKETNDMGGVMVDVGEGSPDFPLRGLDIDTLDVEVQCGFDVCNKVYRIGDYDFPKRIDYVLQEKPAPQPTPQPTPILESQDKVTSN